MEVKMLCSTNGLRLDQTGQSIHIYTNWYTLFHEANNSVLLNEFSHPNFLNAAGIIELNMFTTNPFFVSISIYEKEQDWIQASINDLETLQMFMFCLWLVKDNACNVITLFTYPQEGEIFRRRRNVFISNCQGLYTDTVFTVADFEEAFVYFEKILEISTKVEDNNKNEYKMGDIVPGKYNSKPYNSNSRIERAITFLQLARNTSFLPQKISFYVLTLECLFSADDMGDIKHKISERVAFYLGETPEQKSVLFKDINTFYNIRSKYLHGQQLENKHNKIEFQNEASLKLDDITRKVLKKVLTVDSDNFTLDKDPLREWFLKMLFQ